MRWLFCLWMLMLCTVPVAAQASLQAGDAPRADRIQVQAIEDMPMMVALAGESGAVFPSAAVAVRNLYTGATGYGQAAFDGSFRVEVAGTAGMMYQVNTASRFPIGERESYTTLPGTGTLIYAAPDDPTQFTTGGKLSYGGAVWDARGQVNTVTPRAGDDISLSLDVMMRVPDADLSLAYDFTGRLLLRPVFDAGGQPISNMTGDGWSSTLTNTELPVLGSPSPDVLLAETPAQDIAVDSDAGTIALTFDFTASLPDSLDGVYVPVFEGQVTVADGAPVNWYANRLFSTEGNGNDDPPAVLLPLALRINEPDMPQVVVSLFDRVADEAAGQFAVANRTIHTPPLTVRPPGTYDVSPRLPQMRTTGVDAPPALPLVAADATLQMTSPDGTTDALPINGLKIETDDLWLNAPDYTFSQYGDYTLRLSGVILDAMGNRYDINGTYPLTIAEPLTLHPAALPGTPFQPGDIFNGQISVLPVFPAETTVTVYAGQDVVLDACEQSCLHMWDDTGAYRVDYVAQYTDSEGRLWAGSLRTAGIVTDNIGFGQRGLADGTETNPQVWFDTRAYPADVPDARPIVNSPFFSGDVAYVPDGSDGGIDASLSASEGVSYMSVIRPALPLRQFVIAADGTRANGQPLWVTNDDKLNNQIGVGSAGNQAEDILLVFGGGVSDDQTTGYAAAAIVTDDDHARVVPPFTTPLLEDNGKPVEMLVLPTSARAGNRYMVGETLHFSGYMVPTLGAEVDVIITTPDGDVINRSGTANAFGYLTLSEGVPLTAFGIYQVRVEAHYAGDTSQGSLERSISGYPLGVRDEAYLLFVVPEDTPLLATSRPGISDVVGGQVITINVQAPSEWSDVQAYYVVRTASTVIEQGELNTFANQTNYQFNWSQIARLYPNIEATARTPSDIDEITFHFAMTGADANGESQIRVRSFTLRGNQLITQGETN